MEQAGGPSNEVTEQHVSAALEEANVKVGDTFIRPSWSNLSVPDRDVLRAMASAASETVPVAYLRAQLGVTADYLGAYRRRLID